MTLWQGYWDALSRAEDATRDVAALVDQNLQRTFGMSDLIVDQTLAIVNRTGGFDDRVGEKPCPGHRVFETVELLFTRGGGSPTCFADVHGYPRVLANRYDLAGMVDAAFDQIRHGEAGHPAVLIHLADSLGKLSDAARNEEMREILMNHLGKLAETAEANIDVPADLSSVMSRIAVASAAVAERAAGERWGPARRRAT
jgi:hypothetical protein